MESAFHSFLRPISSISLPERFTNPFHYTPHPLCVIATEETQAYLKNRTEWAKELRNGKMFGVLVVRHPLAGIGYLAAFSGNLAGKSVHPFFVPPIYDLSRPGCFFRVEEEKISEINHKIQRLMESEEYREALRLFREESTAAREILSKEKARLKEAKKARDLRRQNHPYAQEMAALIKESQFQKAEFKRLEQSLKTRLANYQAHVDRLTAEIEALKQERKTRSATLQLKLFEQFHILNARGEAKDLRELFASTPQGTPPAGAGECAAPKLLQYAYLHQMEPIAMAEFWWGNSPKTEIRHHGYYYPACKGKCEPILKHMLQGLSVESNTLLEKSGRERVLEILFEDESLLVINKPNGMLSVPGKNDADSVYQQLCQRYPEATGPLLVHRLDMATSGLLLAAKKKEIHQNLQAQFKNRTIEKRYIAILDGEVARDEGTINLPLSPDLLDRPRQIVDREHGKPAITHYRVLERRNRMTRVLFSPRTGRTHQLRIHAAHPLGLHCPILGDTLYGREAERLYLHAECLTFTHPVTARRIEIHSETPF